MPDELLNKPTLFLHLREVIDAIRILGARASGATGKVTLSDICDYYYRVGNYEGSIKDFIVLFTAVENIFDDAKR